MNVIKCVIILSSLLAIAASYPSAAESEVMNELLQALHGEEVESEEVESEYEPEEVEYDSEEVEFEFEEVESEALAKHFRSRNQDQVGIPLKQTILCVNINLCCRVV